MKQVYVAELAVGARVCTELVIRSKELRATRAGEAYLSLVLADRSGSLPGVLFRPAPQDRGIPVGTVVRVTGTVTTYRGAKRISIEHIVPARTWDGADFVPTSSVAAEELEQKLFRLVHSISDPKLRATVRGVFSDQGFLERFRVAPASQAYHHAHLSGLLEHTVAVASICAHLSERYPGVDRDLLVAAALLHDVGKVEELAVGAAIDYTDEGRLLGHVVLGLVRVREACRRARLSKRTALLLEHTLLSHHGELEWGSPKRPVTIEALLLHHVDNLDAKAAGFLALAARASRVDEVWTDANNLFRRPLYAPRPAEDERVRRVDDEAVAELLSA